MAQIFGDDGIEGIPLVDASNIQITCPEMSISSTRTEVPRNCSPVEGKRSYPRTGQHRVTLWSCHGMRSTHPSSLRAEERVYLTLSKYGWLMTRREAAQLNSYTTGSSFFVKKQLQKIADSKARVVKTRDLEDEAELVFGEEVRITTEGQRHLGAAIGSQEYKDQ